jgi:rubrerythrin
MTRRVDFRHPGGRSRRTFTVSTLTAVDERITRLPEPAALLAEMGAPLDPNTYDWGGARPGALRDEEIFQLTYAAHVEWGTEGTFASLDISRDPVVRQFLRVWLDQEVVHADLLARLVRGCGAPIAPIHRDRKHRWGAARGKVLNQVARLGIGDDFFAVHMSWGAINELTTLRFYSVMRANTDSSLLRALLRDVIAQEALHYSFYRSVAIRRLAGNPRGQRIVRWALEHLWSPVGVGLRTREDVDRLMRGLFEDRPDQVVQMDSQINRIPGLEGLDLIRRTVEPVDPPDARTWSDAGGAARQRRFAAG